MNDNIDKRMANYLTILSNREISKNLDPKALYAVEKALSIYAEVTATSYIEDYQRKKAAEENVEEASRRFR